MKLFQVSFSSVQFEKISPDRLKKKISKDIKKFYLGKMSIELLAAKTFINAVRTYKAYLIASTIEETRKFEYLYGFVNKVIVDIGSKLRDDIVHQYREQDVEKMLEEIMNISDSNGKVSQSMLDDIKKKYNRRTGDERAYN